MPPVTAEDLISPQGDLDIEQLFPEEDGAAIRAKLANWISDGETVLGDVVTDELEAANAVKHYAYYKAFHEVYVRMSTSPLQAQVSNEASESYNFLQIREVEKIASSHLDSFNGIIQRFTLVAVETPNQSRAVKTRISW